MQSEFEQMLEDIIDVAGYTVQFDAIENIKYAYVRTAHDEPFANYME